MARPLPGSGEYLKIRMKLLLVDGHSLAYRAFFAMPQLSNSKGQAVQAVLGVANMIFRILKEEKPTHMIVFFDRGIPQFRLDAYEAYKAHRPETPGDLASQIPLIKEFFQALDIRVMEQTGFEADDWIAAAVKQAETCDSSILILTGDLDMLQLVSEKTAVLASKKGISQLTRYDLAEVQKRYELSPSQLIDLKALTGDASDNIRGAPGIGEKGGIKLLKEWGNIQALLENRDKLPPKISRALESSQELLETNRNLILLRSDAPLEFRPSNCRIVPYNPEKLREFLEKMEFKNLMARLDLSAPAHFDSVEFQTATSDTDLNQLAEQFRQSPQAALLLWPVLSPFPEQSRIGVEFPDGKRWIVPEKRAPEVLKKLAAAPAGKEIFTHNWKAFLLAFKKLNLQEPDWKVQDVLLQGWLCNSLRPNPSIPDLAKDHLNRPLPESDSGFPSLAAHWTSVLLPLGKELKIKLEALGLESLYRTVELPLSPVLADMEWEGAGLDLPYLSGVSVEFKNELARLEEEIYRDAGIVFNINSPKQLAEVLYEKLNLAKGKKIKTGFSTDVEELTRLAAESPVAGRILEYRELAKLLGTYVDVFPRLADANGRLHTSYLQAGTATGRLASKDPNLQNIPIRTEYGKKIRRAFVAGKPGWKILSADYSQIELRLLAHFSGDEVLREAFRNNEDIHARTAGEIFNVSPEEVTPEMRRMAKVVNFGIIYGMTEHGLSQNLGMKKDEARLYIEKYLSRFPRVQSYLESSLEAARETGMTRTLFGRMRPVPELQSPKSFVRKQGERIAVNAPLQGTVADMMKLAMIRIHRHRRQTGLAAVMVMQVHDELVFEVREGYAAEAARLIKNEMENAAALEVPLRVDVAAGDNWADVR